MASSKTKCRFVYWQFINFKANYRDIWDKSGREVINLSKTHAWISKSNQQANHFVKVQFLKYLVVAWVKNTDQPLTKEEVDCEAILRLSEGNSPKWTMQFQYHLISPSHSCTETKARADVRLIVRVPWDRLQHFKAGYQPTGKKQYWQIRCLKLAYGT